MHSEMNGDNARNADAKPHRRRSWPWMLVFLLYPFVTFFVWTPCLCDAGAARANIMWLVCLVIWGRILVGGILNERKWKIVLYMILPLVLSWVTERVMVHAFRTPRHNIVRTSLAAPTVEASAEGKSRVTNVMSADANALEVTPGVQWDGVIRDP